jgi:hypothetical protein
MICNFCLETKLNLDLNSKFNDRSGSQHANNFGSEEDLVSNPQLCPQHLLWDGKTQHK